jgi:hypothetical protein
MDNNMMVSVKRFTTHVKPRWNPLGCSLQAICGVCHAWSIAFLEIDASIEAF